MGMHSPKKQTILTKNFFDFRFHRLIGGYYIQIPLFSFLFLYSLKLHNERFFFAIFVFVMYCFFTSMMTLKVSLFDQKINTCYKILIYYPHLFVQTLCLFSAIPLSIILCILVMIKNKEGFFCLSEFVILMSVFVSLYCILIRRKWIKTCHYTLPIMPDDMEFTITHITDLHIGNLTSLHFLKKVVRKVNKENSDLIVITGDLITVGDEFIAEIAHELSLLKSREGVMISFGNHDYYCHDFNVFISILRSKNLNVLHNQFHLIEQARQKICIVGIAGIVDNIAKQEEAIALSISKDALRDDNQTNILLAHDASIFSSEEVAPFDLILSGHTHGGQFGVPHLYRTLNLAKLFYPFSSGFFKKNNRNHLYVNSGIGVDFLPVRFGVAPEIAVFTLSKAKGYHHVIE